MRVPSLFRRGVVLPELKYVASPNFSTRAAPIDLIVLHDTEGGYEGAVSWFRNPASQVSAHLVLREDGREATQMVPFSKKAWHVATFNSRSIGVEMAGFAKKGYSEEELRRAARLVAFLTHRFKLPAHMVKADALGRIRPGFTLHQYLGAAGGGHHDPGFTDDEARAFETLVKEEAARGGFRRSFGRM